MGGGRVTGINITGPLDSTHILYVNGVSLTHGHNPHEHFWTFAKAAADPSFKCPCIYQAFLVSLEMTTSVIIPYTQ